jgi:hypothetical protein
MPKQLFGMADAFVGELDSLALFVDGVVFFSLELALILRKGAVQILGLCVGAEIMSGVRASSIRIESISSTIAKRARAGATRLG